MNFIKGFYKLPQLADNDQGEIARFGELSTYALTFSKEIGSYTNLTQFPRAEWVVFSQEDNNRNFISIPAAVQAETLAVGQWLCDKHLAKQIPSNANASSFVSSIESEFPNIRSVILGSIESGVGGTERMPVSIRFDMVADGVVYRIENWLSDTTFRQQYPNFTILVVPPVVDINFLNRPTEDVNRQLNENRTSYTINRINVLKGDHPETRIAQYDMTWHDPNNPDSQLTTTWVLIIYGQFGDELDSYKDAVREYLSDNAPNVDWNPIYPELYSDNEFLFIPFWDKVAIRTNSNDQSLYSSLIPLGEFGRITQDILPDGYGVDRPIAQFVAEQSEVLSVHYRNLMVTVVGSPNNINDVNRLSDQFPDYMDADPTLPDFSRMSTKTQRFSIALNEALNIAREYVDSEPVPEGYFKTTRNSRTYIGFEFEGFNYTIITRQGYVQE